MPRTMAVLFAIALSVGTVVAQTGTRVQAASAAKPPTAAGQVAEPTPAKPTAIIDTTAGKMTCTLFPDKAPIGVENFIGLATGTKDWKNPVSGATKHGVPLYDGTIFHRGAGHQRLAVLHHRGGDAASERKLHYLRPMRRSDGCPGERDRSHGQRPQQ